MVDPYMVSIFSGPRYLMVGLNRRTRAILKIESKKREILAALAALANAGNAAKYSPLSIEHPVSQLWQVLDKFLTY